MEQRAKAKIITAKKLEKQLLPAGVYRRAISFIMHKGGRDAGDKNDPDGQAKAQDIIFRWNLVGRKPGNMLLSLVGDSSKGGAEYTRN